MSRKAAQNAIFLCLFETGNITGLCEPGSAPILAKIGSVGRFRGNSIGKRNTSNSID